MGYFINSWTGVITILLLYFSVYWFISTIKDPSSNRTLGQVLIGLIGAPIFAIYLLINIYNFFSISKDEKNNSHQYEAVNAVESAEYLGATVEAEPPAVEYIAEEAIAVDNSYERAAYSYLNNGESPLDSCFGSGKYEGQAYITFKNSNDSDAIVCLVNYSSNKTIRNEYIQAGSDFTMNKIPSGSYIIKVYYGNDWNPQKENFCGSHGGFNYDESFSISDNPSDLVNIENSNQGYTTGSITLYKVANGNMGSRKISENDFFKQ